MLSFFLRDGLDEIWDLIDSVSKGFLTYFSESPKITNGLVQHIEVVVCASITRVIINSRIGN